MAGALGNYFLDKQSAPNQYAGTSTDYSKKTIVSGFPGERDTVLFQGAFYNYTYVNEL